MNQWQRMPTARFANALGYLGDPQTLSERLLQRTLAPRTRKPLENFVFSGRWNETSPLVTPQ